MIVAGRLEKVGHTTEGKASAGHRWHHWHGRNYCELFQRVVGWPATLGLSPGYNTCA